jgi:hypothetical protein
VSVKANFSGELQMQFKMLFRTYFRKSSSKQDQLKYFMGAKDHLYWGKESTKYTFQTKYKKKSVPI